MKGRTIKMLGACVLAALALSAVAAAQASAIEFIYKVNGAKLEAGKEKELVSKAKGNQVLKTTVLGVATEITCTGVSTAGAKIIGGKPGTSTETVKYSGCTVNKPSGCKVKEGTITTNPLKNEVVEGVGASAGKALVLFKPVSGETFAEPKLEGGFLCPSLAVKGSVLAEPLPQKSEVAVGALKFEPAESKKFKNSKGEELAAGLKVGSSAATVTGEDETELSTKEKFGIF
jgi:hypothetical protein